MSLTQQGGSDPRRIDWRGHIVERVELVYLILLDALAIFTIAAIGPLFEYGFTRLTGELPSWTFGAMTLTLVDIVHYGDLLVFAIFLVVSCVHVLKWAIKG